MNDTQLLILSRAVDRLLVDVFAGISLVLGWNLFRAGITRNQTAEFSKGGWAVKLQRVGPGVLFAFFGIACLSISIIRPLRYDSTGPVVVPATKVLSASVETGPAATPNAVIRVAWSNSAEAALRDAMLEDQVKAINTLGRVLPATRLQKLTVVEQTGLSRSQGILDRLKRQLLTERFGDGFARYELYRERAATDPAVLADLTPTVKAEYSRIDRVVTGSLFGE
jgi:hypothetical protein